MIQIGKEKEKEEQLSSKSRDSSSQSCKFELLPHRASFSKECEKSFFDRNATRNF